MFWWDSIFSISIFFHYEFNAFQLQISSVPSGFLPSRSRACHSVLAHLGAEPFFKAQTCQGDRMLQAITGHLPAGVGKSWENGTPK